jgi:hypothetical protein
MKRVIIAVVIGAAVFGIASAVQASIPDSQGIVHACYKTTNLTGYPIGSLRARDTDTIQGQICSPTTEAPVDLATPQYVQNQIAQALGSFQFQTMLIGPAGSVAANSDGSTSAACPGGYIATGGSLVINQFGALFDVVTLDGWNDGLFAGGAPDGAWTMEVHNNTGGAVTIATQVTCSLGSTLGLSSIKGPAKVRTP